MPPNKKRTVYDASHVDSRHYRKRRETVRNKSESFLFASQGKPFTVTWWFGELPKQRYPKVRELWVFLSEQIEREIVVKAIKEFERSILRQIEGTQEEHR